MSIRVALIADLFHSWLRYLELLRTNSDTSDRDFTWCLFNLNYLFDNWSALPFLL